MGNHSSASRTFACRVHWGSLFSILWNSYIKQQEENWHYGFCQQHILFYTVSPPVQTAPIPCVPKLAIRHTISADLDGIFRIKHSRNTNIPSEWVNTAHIGIKNTSCCNVAITGKIKPNAKHQIEFLHESLTHAKMTQSPSSPPFQKDKYQTASQEAQSKRSVFLLKI